jgi:hypothetical protein
MIHAPVIKSVGCSPGFDLDRIGVSPEFILKYQCSSSKNQYRVQALGSTVINSAIWPRISFFQFFFILLYRRYYSYYVSWYKQDVLYHELIVKELLTDESIKTAKVQQLA